jgi:excisionase family DNA binding protein
MSERTSLDQALGTIREVIEAKGPKVLDSKWDGRSSFTVDEAAEILRVCRGTAYGAVKRGDIPAVRVGKRLIVPRHALERKLGA